MKNGFRNSMTWLHTWCGLFLGWVLFAIFITGTASYYRPEITRWMQPEIRPQAAVTKDLLTRALTEVRRNAPNATSIYIRFPVERDAGLQLNWETPDGKRTAKVVDAQTARIEARDTRGGEFFYRFHFQLQLPYPWGRFIACLAAAFMLVALFTGIVAHRQFFKDFFTFRPSKPGTRSWLDFHNLSGVIALPFYLMIAFSAQVIFLEMIMPWGKLATEPPAVVTGAGPAAAPTIAGSAASASVPDTLYPLPTERMLAEYASRFGDRPIAWLYAAGLGTPAARVSIGSASDGKILYDSHGTLNFEAATGAMIPEERVARGIFTKIHDALYGLHMIRFADPVLRGLFFLMGLLGSMLVATGLVLWTVKRRKRQETLHGTGRSGFGHWLVERLNIATIVGFPLALSTLLWANRLLPIGLPNRGDMEVTVVFVTWGLAYVHACLRPVLRGWQEQMWTASALFTLVPFLDVVSTPGAAHRFGFNLTILGMGGLWAWGALRVGSSAARRAGQATQHAPAIHPSPEDAL